MSNPFAGSNNSTREINKQLELTASALESRASELKISNNQLRSIRAALSSLLSSMRAERMQREAGEEDSSSAAASEISG